MSQKNNKNDFYEIDIADYIKVFFKRKFQFFWILILTIFIIFIVTLLITKTYESRAVLKMGTFQGKKIEAPVEITEILLEKPALTKIAQRIDIKNPSDAILKEIEQQLEIDSENNIIMINAKGNTSKSSQELALAISNFIIERHKEMFDEKQNFWNNRIAIIKDKITALEEETAQLQKQKIEVDKNVNLFTPPANEAQALALQGYLLSSSRIDNNINSNKSQIKTLEDDLSNIDLQGVDNTNTHLISKPALPEKPTTPKLKLNLIIGSLLGIFLGLFGAFLCEWWQHNKEKILKK